MVCEVRLVGLCWQFDMLKNFVGHLPAAALGSELGPAERERLQTLECLLMTRPGSVPPGAWVLLRRWRGRVCGLEPDGTAEDAGAAAR